MTQKKVTVNRPREGSSRDFEAVITGATHLFLGILLLESITRISSLRIGRIGHDQRIHAGLERSGCCNSVIKSIFSRKRGVRLRTSGVHSMKHLGEALIHLPIGVDGASFLLGQDIILGCLLAPCGKIS